LRGRLGLARASPAQARTSPAALSPTRVPGSNTTEPGWRAMIVVAPHGPSGAMRTTASWP